MLTCMKADRQMSKQAKKWRIEWCVDKKTNLLSQRERKPVKRTHRQRVEK